MIRKIKKKFKAWFFGSRRDEISPDEILLDASNLPQFDTDQFEGRLEKPISKKSLQTVFFFFALICALVFVRTWFLQVSKGEAYLERSENNRLRYTHIFSNRGVIYDRKGLELAFNTLREGKDFAERKYYNMPGFSHVLGYVKYPSKDKHGFYWETNYVGKDGVELFYNTSLSGENGLRIVETDALNQIRSQVMTKPPVDGEAIELSIDADLQTKFFEIISDTSEKFNYHGGAGLVMDVSSGELIAAVSFPEFSSEILSNGTQDQINEYLNSPDDPFVNRFISGLYAPGSVIKPFLAAAAINEGIVNPDKKILSTSRIAVPNPYFPDRFSYFSDWKAHGLVNMIDAIAVSSNIYFYHIGGGFDGQEGLGISRINKYLSDFGLGKQTSVDLFGELLGVVPNPEWKKLNFDGDEWRLGDTFNTSIGQYGLQVTPLQIVRAVGALANGGRLVKPTLLKVDKTPKFEKVDLSEESFEVAKDGMRQAVLRGTAGGLNVPFVEIAAKTGTAEIGRSYIHSWITGFFPFQSPRYAFVVVMERGPYSNTTGGVYVMRQLIDWMFWHAPEYLK